MRGALLGARVLAGNAAGAASMRSPAQHPQVSRSCWRASSSSFVRRSSPADSAQVGGAALAGGLGRLFPEREVHHDHHTAVAGGRHEELARAVGSLADRHSGEIRDDLSVLEQVGENCIARPGRRKDLHSRGVAALPLGRRGEKDRSSVRGDLVGIGERDDRLEKVGIRRAGEPLRHGGVLRIDGPVGGARDAVEAGLEAGLGCVDQRLRLGGRRRRRLGRRRLRWRGCRRSAGRCCCRGRRRLGGRFRRSRGLRLGRGLGRMLRRGLRLWRSSGRSRRGGFGRLILILGLGEQKVASARRDGRRWRGGDAKKGGASQTSRRAPHALPEAQRNETPDICLAKLKPQTPGTLLGPPCRT
jgi:hypothetical protein